MERLKNGTCTDVYLCILDISGAQDYCGSSYFCSLPLNSMTASYTGSSKIHVELAFIVNYKTLVSINVYNGGVVSCTNGKQYSREDAWEFHLLRGLSSKQKNDAYCFALSKLGCSFNSCGLFCIPFFSWSGGGQKFTCSELTMQTFHAMGLFKNYESSAAYPGLFKELIREHKNRFRSTPHLRSYLNGTKF